MKSSDSLFHYTNATAVASIIAKSSLWFTHIEYLNDSTELDRGARILLDRLEMQNLFGLDKEAADRALEFVCASFSTHVRYGYEKSPLFTCSFSRAADLLSQWRAYGNYAVEFSMSAMRDQFDIHDCIYDINKQRLHADLMVDSVIESVSAGLEQNGVIGPDELAAFNSLVISAAQFKDASFHEEQESRIILDEPQPERVLHRSRGDMLVPYLELEFDRRAIRAIHVGPLANQVLAARAVKSLLVAHGMEMVPVVCSNTPFRS